MTEVHLLAGWLAVGATALVIVASLAGLALGDHGRLWLWLDRAILAGVLIFIGGALTGLPLLIGGGPDDILHLVYALAAPAILLGGRYLGRGPDIRRRSALVLVGALAVLGVTLRLFTTA